MRPSFEHPKHTLKQIDKKVLTVKLFSYFSTKACVVGTQKNRLNETVLLSTQNIC